MGGSKSKKGAVSKAKPVYDYTDETVYFEGKPSAGDLAVNVALGATLLWLPPTIAAVGRFAWVNYKITNRRISVSNTSPIANGDEKQLDCAMEEVSDVVRSGGALVRGATWSSSSRTVARSRSGPSISGRK